MIVWEYYYWESYTMKHNWYFLDISNFSHRYFLLEIALSNLLSAKKNIFSHLFHNSLTDLVYWESYRIKLYTFIKRSTKCYFIKFWYLSLSNDMQSFLLTISIYILKNSNKFINSDQIIIDNIIYKVSLNRLV